MKQTFNKSTLAKLAAEGKPALVKDTIEKGLKFKTGPRRSVFIFEKRVSGRKGAPITFTLGTFKALTISEARQEARRLATLCEKGIDPREDKIVESDAVITCEMAIEKFFDLKKGTKAETIRCYKVQLGWFPEEWKTLDINNISPRMLASCYRSIHEQYPDSAKKFMKLFLNIWNTCKVYFVDENDESLLKTCPVMMARQMTRDLKLKQPKRSVVPCQMLGKFVVLLEKFLNDEMVFKSKRSIHLSKQLYGASLLGLFTGFRFGESSTLEWANVDLEEGLIFLAGEAERGSAFKGTKNKADHWVPLSSYAWTFLQGWKERYPESRYVFQREEEERPVYTSHVHFQYLSRHLGTHFSPHAARRTFASVANEAGLGILDIKRMMNHLYEGDVTDRYIRKSFNPGNDREKFQKVCDFILDRRAEYLGEKAVESKEPEEASKKLKRLVIELGFTLEEAVKELSHHLKEPETA